MNTSLIINTQTHTLVDAFALRHRPDWCASFTANRTSRAVRVTYSDRLTYGVSLDEAMAYCDRHDRDYTPVTVCTTKAVARQWLLTRYQLEANRAA
jgi:hypothetical protein